MSKEILENLAMRDLRKKFPNVQIITHTDNDGYGAGGILVAILHQLLGYQMDKILVTNTEYSNPLPFDLSTNLVFISDISISNGPDATKLLDYEKNKSKLVFWFDHHQSSIKMEEFYPELKKIPGLRSVDASATMLCWFFYQLARMEIITINSDMGDMDRNLKNLIVKEIMEREDNPGILPEYENINFNARTPKALILIDDYDRFVLKYPESMYLMDAFNNYPALKHDCKSEWFSYYTMAPDEIGEEMLSRYLKFGKALTPWKRCMQLKTLKEYGRIASITVEGMQGIDVICINYPGAGSKFFGKTLGYNTNHPAYQFGCIYKALDHASITLSFYYVGPDVDENDKKLGGVYNALDIAKKLGGGGHKGAAGCVVDRLPFRNVRPLPKDIIDVIDAELDEVSQELNEMISTGDQN